MTNYLLQKARTGDSTYQLEQLSADTTAELSPGDILITSPDELLSCYRDTDTDQPLYTQLQLIRDGYLKDMSELSSASEIYGLIFWLLHDQGINYGGESLEETADRLCDLDIDADHDRYSTVIFHLRNAIDQLCELELDEE